MNNEDILELLREIVRIPSPSYEEEAVVDCISSWLTAQGIAHTLPNGNIAAVAATPDSGKPTLALLAHLDTVSPAPGYSRDPYDSGSKPGFIRGLGANDDGGSVVALLAAFRHFYGKELPVNLILLLDREEECSGPDGARWLFGPEGPFAKGTLPMPDWTIVGEPTGLKAATSERGLLVLDGEAVGVSGHAARGEGVNAIYLALDDIAKLQAFHFPKVSQEMGEVRISVTQIKAGTAHNVVPDRCSFVVDIRPTEQYANEEILSELQMLCKSTLRPRNLLHRASATAPGSPLRKAVAAAGIETFSSPTSSDWMLLPCDAIKIGPGDSSRSHRADEYIREEEIHAGIETYIHLIEQFYGNIVE